MPYETKGTSLSVLIGPATTETEQPFITSSQ